MIMFLYVDKEMFHWLVDNESGWYLSQEATDALYEEYYEDTHCELDDILNEYLEAIEMTVPEILEECEDKFKSEDEVLNYIESEYYITIDDEKYYIDCSFINSYKEKAYVLKKL